MEIAEVVKIQVILCGFGYQFFLRIPLLFKATWAGFHKISGLVGRIKNDRGKGVIDY